ncbi:MAG: DUF2807 domain-containing protein [Bacteroidia bacterium]|nr:DUF2807 domain-containing protein [Bacteroidia bacterium]
MKKKIYSAFFGLLSMAAIAQTAENKTVAPFSVLELKGAVKVEIVSYDSLFCTVSAEGKEMQNILFTQSGDKLIISTVGGMKEDYKIKLGCKGLKQVITDGASALESEVIYKTDSISVNADGASKAKLMIEAKKINVKADGVASVRLKGKAEQLNASADGSSKIKAFFMEAINAEVKSDGVSSIVVNVKQKLNANAKGASKIYYAGKPIEKSLEKSDVGQVKEYTDEQAANENNTSRKWKWDYDGGFKHWMGVGLNFNGFTTADYQTTLPVQDSYMDLNYGKSIGWNLNVIEHDFHIWKNYINLCTGIGFEFDKYNFKNKITLNPDSSYVVATVNPANNYKKNVLKATYINIPLFFDINTSKNPDKTFHIGAGAIFGYKMGSRTKQFYDNDGYEHSIYKKDDYNLNPFKVQAMLQVGYGRFTVYGNYTLTSLFEKNKGPELYPFALGIRIIPFD